MVEKEDKKNNASPSTTVIRVRKATSNLLRGQGRTMDEAIMGLWNKLVAQSKELKEWKSITACKSPSELLVKRQRLMEQEMKRLKENVN